MSHNLLCGFMYKMAKFSSTFQNFPWNIKISLQWAIHIPHFSPVLLIRSLLNEGHKTEIECSINKFVVVEIRQQNWIARGIHVLLRQHLVVWSCKFSLWILKSPLFDVLPSHFCSFFFSLFSSSVTRLFISWVSSDFYLMVPDFLHSVGQKKMQPRRRYFSLLGHPGLGEWSLEILVNFIIALATKIMWLFLFNIQDISKRIGTYKIAYMHMWPIFNFGNGSWFWKSDSPFSKTNEDQEPLFKDFWLLVRVGLIKSLPVTFLLYSSTKLVHFEARANQEYFWIMNIASRGHDPIQYFPNQGQCLVMATYLAPKSGQTQARLAQTGARCFHLALACLTFWYTENQKLPPPAA